MSKIFFHFKNSSNELSQTQSRPAFHNSPKANFGRGKATVGQRRSVACPTVGTLALGWQTGRKTVQQRQVGGPWNHWNKNTDDLLKRKQNTQKRLPLINVYATKHKLRKCFAHV